MRDRACFPKLCFFLCLLVLSLAVFCAASADELPTNYNQALKYVKANKPMEAVATKVGWTPAQLTEIRKALPEGAVFRFTCKWNGVSYSDDTEALDLNKAKKNINEASLRQMIALCPNLKSVDNSAKRLPTNETFIALMEQYPEIHFEWMVHLRGEHYCPTNATAYSTLNHTDSGTRLKDEHMVLFKYIPGLKALDLGHNALTNLDFLHLYPDLELLIITLNGNITDVTEIGNLKHLKYLEMDDTNVADISPLANCTELLDLNVSCTLVTDLSPLDNVTSLERLWANHQKKLPKSEQTRFKELHPDCKTDFTVNGSPTSHKWHEHPRFYHYRKCFKRKVWVPFDQPWPEGL